MVYMLEIHSVVDTWATFMKYYKHKGGHGKGIKKCSVMYNLFMVVD